MRFYLLVALIFGLIVPQADAQCGGGLFGGRFGVSRRVERRQERRATNAYGACRTAAAVTYTYENVKQAPMQQAPEKQAPEPLGKTEVDYPSAYVNSVHYFVSTDVPAVTDIAWDAVPETAVEIPQW